MGLTTQFQNKKGFFLNQTATSNILIKKKKTRAKRTVSNACKSYFFLFLNIILFQKVEWKKIALICLNKFWLSVRKTKITMLLNMVARGKILHKIIRKKKYLATIKNYENLIYYLVML